MALAVAMPDDAQAMASSPKPWPWERRSWHQAPGKVTKPQAMAIASGHGSRPWPWLGPQAYGQRNVSMGIGCRVWGVGYWVVDIGYRVLVFGYFGFLYRVAASLLDSNMLDARWVGRFWYFDIFGNWVVGIRWWRLGSGDFHSLQHARRQMGRRILDNRIFCSFDVFGNWVVGIG